jgi:Tol biopolymer transport system component
MTICNSHLGGAYLGMTRGWIIIFNMKTRLVIAALVVVVLVAIGMFIFAWNARPRLVEIYPHEGALNVPATTAIRLVFSGAMNPDTVSERLKIKPEINGKFAWQQNVLTFTPDQNWPPGQEVKLSIEAGARAASWLSFPMNGRAWSFKTNAAMLAYLWPSYGKADIYALIPDTGEITRFTNDMGVLDFSMSTNGIMIYFSAINSKGGASLYKIDRTVVRSQADSITGAQEILDCGSAQCRNPVASYDRQYLAYEYIIPSPSGGSGPAQIWLLNLATQQTSAVGLENDETVQPAWSSKGLLAYYDITSSGYEVVNMATYQRTLMANQTGQPGDWSPSGEYYLAPEIFYYRAPDNTERGTSHLMQYNPVNNQPQDISNSPDVEDAEAVYSPDGTSIAFARKFLDAARWTLGRQLWLMNSDGSNAHPITDEADYNHYDLAWSRDGKRLAYVRFDESKPADPPELWMIDVDGSNALQLVIGGYSPIWIP